MGANMLNINTMKEADMWKYLNKRTAECMIKNDNAENQYTDIDKYVDKTIQYFSSENLAPLHSYETGLLKKEEFIEYVRERINQYPLTKAEKEGVLQGYMKYMWSYDIVDELINDPNISDIKLIEPTKITVKCKGERQVSNITFRGEEHYRGFIQRVATRNQVNLSNLNAVQYFTDINSNEAYRLRFNITTDLINSNRYPCMHIRKIPKFKYRIEELLREGMFSLYQIAYLIQAVETGSSMLFCGKGGSGKTTLINLLLDYFPYHSSILCIQENDEMFSDYHPDIICQNTIENRGEGIHYTLKDLAKNGLLLDIDWFIIGEVKGEEARYLFDASCTGASCMTTLHASCAEEALIRLADLAKRASDYSQEDILRILSNNFSYVIYMEDFKIKELIEIRGWDNEKNSVIYESVPGGIS